MTPGSTSSHPARRVDRGSLLGLAMGLAAVMLGTLMEGGELAALVQPAAAVIVLGGTSAAVLLSTPLSTFSAAIAALGSVFVEPTDDSAALIDALCDHAQRVRREGVLALESAQEAAHDPFLRRALSMALEGADSKAMRHDLERLRDRADDAGLGTLKVWESAAGYAPTIGILGAVIGLIQVMQNLHDVSMLGRGIAVAFVATIYGVGLANLLCLPVAEKLRLRHEQRMLAMELVLEGVVAIHEGQKPQLIREKLSHLEREASETDAPSSLVLRRFPLLK